MLHHRNALAIFAASGLSLAVLGGCTKPATDQPAANPATPAAAAPRESDPACVGPVASAPEEKLTINGLSYTRKGSTISLDGPGDADDDWVLGQITDIKDHNPDNAANLKVMVEWMTAQKVDAIAATGDLGETAESIEKVLRDLAVAKVPVLVVIGNRECKDHFTAGVAAAQKDFPNIINMNTVRVFNTDDASVVSMPGYYNKDYLHCTRGCEYLAADVRALPEVAKAATAPARVLISHGPPLQSGPLAIDRIHEGANVGDPLMTEVMQQNPQLFPFGLFGNIQEAGGYATDLTGQTRVAQDTFVDSFVLNPGPIDAVRWVMLDNTESVGMAGVVKFKGKQAMYRIHRLQPGEAKPVAATPPGGAAPVPAPPAPPAPAGGAPAPAPAK